MGQSRSKDNKPRSKRSLFRALAPSPQNNKNNNSNNNIEDGFFNHVKARLGKKNIRLKSFQDILARGTADDCWRSILVRELTNLHNEKRTPWTPKMLEFFCSRCVTNRDVFFQAEIYWIDYIYTSKGDCFDTSDFNLVSFLDSFGQRDTRGEPGNTSLYCEVYTPRVTTSPDPPMLIRSNTENNANFGSSWGASELKSTRSMITGAKAPIIDLKMRASLMTIYDNSNDIVRNNSLIDEMCGGYDNLDDQRKSVDFYKAITYALERHLNHKRNFFAHIVKVFSTTFIELYEKRVIEFTAQDQNMDLDMACDVLEEALDGIDLFTRLLYKGVTAFYGLEEIHRGTKNSLLNADNILTFLNSIVFNEGVYAVIFTLQRCVDRETERRMSGALRVCRDMTLKDFGVTSLFVSLITPPTTNGDFMINHPTTKVMEGKSHHTTSTSSKDMNADEIMRKNKSAKSSFQVVHTIEEEGFIALPKRATLMDRLPKASMHRSSRIGTRASFLISPNYESQIAKAHIDEGVLSDAVKLFVSIQFVRSPLHKFKIISRTARLINTTVENYVKTHPELKDFVMDGDTFLSIYLYVVAKSGVSSIMSHLNLALRFLSENIMSSVAGYYCTTLEACIMHLVDNYSEQ